MSHSNHSAVVPLVLPALCLLPLSDFFCQLITFFFPTQGGLNLLGSLRAPPLITVMNTITLIIISGVAWHINIFISIYWGGGDILTRFEYWGEDAYPPIYIMTTALPPRASGHDEWRGRTQT